MKTLSIKHKSLFSSVKWTHCCPLWTLGEKSHYNCDSYQISSTMRWMRQSRSGLRETASLVISCLFNVCINSMATRNSADAEFSVKFSAAFKQIKKNKTLNINTSPTQAEKQSAKFCRFSSWITAEQHKKNLQIRFEVYYYV